jgi:hypothetical protein
MEIVHAKNQHLVDINKCVNLIHGIVQSSLHIREFTVVCLGLYLTFSSISQRELG